MAKKMNWLEKVAAWLLAIGGVNWLLVGLFKFDLVAWIGKFSAGVATFLYVVIGLAGVFALYKVIRGKK